ncbi:hypothetical protein PGT21_017097 [Puccinia graminis f. sp. tritici]|uniref:DNA 3'-5' helicase n=1 Tax=Puccinia graminis f. sp. tritici TaxID=56615 RepID=A0A5B0Q658_PUCGR|nr:hypothetical protein PGT21_017097 [Puccinia graminis f. sp. tritici]
MDPAFDKQPNQKKRITVCDTLLQKDQAQLEAHIKEKALLTYKQQAKTLQVEAVCSLVRGRNTFVLAGTGFGKSRIAEMYFRLFDKKKKPVVLVLNPLDALRDNQFKAKIARKIVAGFFNFVYLSPEVFLNNSLFKEVYYNPDFQHRLATIVIDEAQMIYTWGLVASGKAKKSSSHGRTKDVAVFRPSYGKLAAQLNATEGVPLLLLSATCRPIAVDSILKNLRITEDNITFVKAELTRPEIRILRLPMNHSLKSCHDLIPVIELQGTRSKNIAPTLIYSGQRNATFQVMKNVNKARGTPGAEYNPRSSMIRRYHANTGDYSKADAVEKFTSGKFPYIACTMALGLGQNWKQVRKVIHMGRADPSNICQMIGCCGRDGRPGLAILFMEKKRKNGKNCVDNFLNVKEQNNDNRMDALAITPVCLRIAFSLDNLCGHIPMSKDDLRYLHEEQREIEQGFPKCRCSNCDPEGAITLSQNICRLTNKNFSDVVNDKENLPRPTINPFVQKKTRQPCKPAPKELTSVLKEFSVHLVKAFEVFFWKKFPKSASFLPEDLFGLDRAHSIAQHVATIERPQDILKDLGGAPVHGQLDLIYECVVKFRQGDRFDQHLREESDRINKLNNEKNQKRVEANARARGKRDLANRETKDETMHRLAAEEKDRSEKRIAAEKKKEKTIEREKAAVKKKEDSKRKWENDRPILEGFKRQALEAAANREVVEQEALAGPSGNGRGRGRGRVKGRGGMVTSRRGRGKKK